MKKILTILVIAIVIVGGYFLANRKDVGDADFGSVIKIGAPLELTGEAANYGENAKKGIELAVKEYNASHERKIEMIYEDNHTEAKEALSTYRKLISVDQVSAIIGPLFQTQAGALLPVVRGDETPTIMISPVPLNDRSGFTNPITVWMDPSEEAGIFAQYVLNQGIKKVAIIGTRDSWEQEVSDAFEAKFRSLGGEITMKEIMIPDTRDTRSTVTKILSTNPDAVFVGTYYQFIPVVKNLDELGYKGKRFGIEVDTYLAGETKPFSNGLQFISPNFYTNEFASKFESEYGEIPALPAGQAYDAMNILLSFIDKSKNKEDILDNMAKFNGFEGVTGRMTMTESHRTLFPTSIFEVQNGEITKIRDNN